MVIKVLGSGCCNCKIKTGDIFEVAEVVKTLMVRDKEKGLSTGEKKMLNNAKQILISELVLAKGVDHSEIESAIDNIVDNSIEDTDNSIEP
jgi:CarD family transcriptional regulator